MTEQQRHLTLQGVEVFLCKAQQFNETARNEQTGISFGKKCSNYL